MFDSIKTVIAYFRGQSGVSLKKALTALLAVLAAGVNAMDDSAEAPVFTAPPPGTAAVTDPAGAIAHLEQMVQDHEAMHSGKSGKKAAAFALPAWLVPILTTLLQQWLAGRK